MPTVTMLALMLVDFDKLVPKDMVVSLGLRNKLVAALVSFSANDFIKSFDELLVLVELRDCK